MERSWSLDEVVQDEHAVVSIGTFDGIHQGHQAILKFLVDRARARKGHGVLVTFDPHPRAVVHGESVPLLTTPGERADACEALGLDRFVVLPFNRTLASLEPEEFVRDILVQRIGLRAMVIGHDHAFGKNRSGDHGLLEKLGLKYGFEVDVIPAQSIDESVVSSSKIRKALLNQGDVAEAAVLLGRPYGIRGHVIRGAQRGRLLGFPTANLKADDERKLIPAVGVYAVRVRLTSGEEHAAMMNIGVRPTFEGRAVHLEAHLLNYEGDLYDETIFVEFVERLRPERRFGSVEALIAQLREDEARCRSLFQSLH